MPKAQTKRGKVQDRKPAFKAKAPGRRKTSSGSKYTENRNNRSDIGSRKR